MLFMKTPIRLYTRKTAVFSIVSVAMFFMSQVSFCSWGHNKINNWDHYHNDFSGISSPGFKDGARFGALSGAPLGALFGLGLTMKHLAHGTGGVVWAKSVLGERESPKVLAAEAVLLLAPLYMAAGVAGAGLAGAGVGGLMATGSALAEGDPGNLEREIQKIVFFSQTGAALGWLLAQYVGISDPKVAATVCGGIGFVASLASGTLFK